MHLCGCGVAWCGGDFISCSLLFNAVDQSIARVARVGSKELYVKP
jgi:hypothetical protein